MAIRDLVLLPDPRLREVCAPIDVVNDDIKELAQDMLETMYDAPGIGLAAPQIGVLKRLIVVDVAERASEESAGEESAEERPEGSLDDRIVSETISKDGQSPAPSLAASKPGPNPIVLINPQVVARSEERSVYQEGCLSIPEAYGEVERPERITVSFLDLQGQKQDLEADGLLATCIQHEIDHINGVLFIDHLSRLKRERITRKFTKMARQREKTAKAG